MIIAGTPFGRRLPTVMLMRALKLTISGESQIVAREFPAVRTSVLVPGALPVTCSGCVPCGGQLVAIEFGGRFVDLRPPEVVVALTHRFALELPAGRQGKAPPEAVHPIEHRQLLVEEVLVPSAKILHDGRVVSVLEIAVDDGGVVGDAVAVQLAQHDVERHVAGVVAVEDAGVPRFGRDGDHARPEIGMREADVPGSIAALGMAVEKYAVGIDGKPPAGVAEAAQHHGMLAGRGFIFRLVRDGPVRRDDDISVASRLALPPGPAA